MTDAESKALRDLITSCEKVVGWLDRSARALEIDYRTTDAPEFRATSAELRKAIKKATAVLKV